MVVIEDFEMPKTCKECGCSYWHDYYGTYFCSITGNDVREDFKEDDCPLVENSEMELKIQHLKDRIKCLETKVLAYDKDKTCWDHDINELEEENKKLKQIIASGLLVDCESCKAKYRTKIDEIFSSN